MKKLLTLAFILVAAPALAQVATPSDRFGFDQAAPDLATANTYQAEVELDGVAQGPQAMTCAGTASPFQCGTAIPAVTPGQHTVRLRVIETINGQALASGYSDPFTFTMRAVPSTPTGIRIEPAP